MYNSPKLMGHNESSAKRKVQSIVFIKKLERSHASDLTAPLKALEQKDIPKRSRRQGLTKLRAETNKIEAKRIQGINETKSRFFEEINKIDKLIQTN